MEESPSGVASLNEGLAEAPAEGSAAFVATASTPAAATADSAGDGDGKEYPVEPTTEAIVNSYICRRIKYEDNESPAEPQLNGHAAFSLTGIGQAIEDIHSSLILSSFVSGVDDIKIMALAIDRQLSKLPDLTDASTEEETKEWYGTFTKYVLYLIWPDQRFSWNGLVATILVTADLAERANADANWHRLFHIVNACVEFIDETFTTSAIEPKGGWNAFVPEKEYGGNTGAPYQAKQSVFYSNHIFPWTSEKEFNLAERVLRMKEEEKEEQEKKEK